MGGGGRRMYDVGFMMCDLRFYQRMYTVLEKGLKWLNVDGLYNLHRFLRFSFVPCSVLLRLFFGRASVPTEQPPNKGRSSTEQVPNNVR